MGTKMGTKTRSRMLGGSASWTSFKELKMAMMVMEAWNDWKRRVEGRRQDELKSGG